MTKEEIIEGNKIIALFEGYEKGLDDKYWKDNIYTLTPDGMKYHNDWNWLMPVVQKIENLTPSGYRFTISTTFVRVHTCKNGKYDDCDEYNCSVFDGKLNTTWYAVVEFIKWYKKNENKK